MLRPTVTNVSPLPDYYLKLVFDNGEVKKFDVKPYIRGTWYGRLQDKAYFTAVKPDGFTVVWPDGQDLCPDELYEDSVPLP
jgi:hypothetical protein